MEGGVRGGYVVVLSGEWSDRSSLLSCIDIVKQVLAETTVEVIEWDVSASAPPVALGRVRVVVCPGGRPKGLKKELSRKGIVNLKQWKVRKDTLFIGICAGAVLAHDLGWSKGLYEMVNDKAWADSGICVDLDIRVKKNIFEEGEDGEMILIGNYENGPLMRVIEGSCVAIATFKGDAAEIKAKQIEDINNNNDSWVCVCTYVNEMRKSKCWFCGELREHELPPIGEMPDTTAGIWCPNKGLLLLSFHPELSPKDTKDWFLPLLSHTILTFINK